MPGSPSSALTSRNFRSAGVLRAVSHLAPTGKYAPPRPRRPESLTSCHTPSLPELSAFSRAAYGLGWKGSTRPTSRRRRTSPGADQDVLAEVQVHPPSVLIAGACQQFPAQPTWTPVARAVSATARLHEPSWMSALAGASGRGLRRPP